MTNAGASHRANRRLSARVACRLVLSYNNSGDTWHPATGMDLSRNGCRLRLGEDLGRESAVRVRIEHPGPDGQLLRADVDGTVIWSRFEGLSYQVGIHFKDENETLQEIIQGLG